ncbi:Cupin domain-containing protein [Microbacterium sp. ru370.1]|uniref:cupin domain-containing protein n=1 Tax=unclassified Microbacterium TaxID=2609290 RepID=UPI000883E062|nr:MULTISPECIES: cupin domain-containing protein [unclassified Microbacterium]SDO25915.1 Cupin domain-containing protein [Microbacterium sp. ru370.1]SIT73964.1 Cupin domain-containing protein [Microbacterium sp. RU1D]
MQIQRRGDTHHDWTLYEGQSRVGIEWYFRDATALGVHAMLYELAPGASEGEHRHLSGAVDSCSAESSDEMYIVTRGEIVFSGDGEERVLAAGDAAYAPAGMRHGVRNASAEPAELVLVFGPSRREAAA